MNCNYEFWHWSDIRKTHSLVPASRAGNCLNTLNRLSLGKVARPVMSALLCRVAFTVSRMIAPKLRFLMETLIILVLVMTVE